MTILKPTTITTRLMVATEMTPFTAKITTTHSLVEMEMTISTQVNKMTQSLAMAVTTQLLPQVAMTPFWVDPAMTLYLAVTTMTQS